MFVTTLPKREADQDALPVCLRRENSNRLVSLWQMLQMHVHEFVKLLTDLYALEVRLEMGIPVNIEQLGQVLVLLQGDCQDFGLTSAQKQIERLFKLFAVAREGQQKISYADIFQHCAQLRVRIQEDLEEELYFRVTLQRARDFFKRSETGIPELMPKTSEEIFGIEVCAKFPSATWEMIEASRCYTFNRHTACVFHLMRATEVGLTALGGQFGVSLAHTNWAPAIDQIESNIRDMHKDPKWKVLPDCKEQQEFYSQAASHFGILKDAWRNYTAHARGKYLEEEAFLIFENTRAFMQKIAARLNE